MTTFIVDDHAGAHDHSRLIEPEQKIAAKIAGILYLVQMAMAIFAEAYVRGRLIVGDDAAQTAANITASERLFRFGIVTDVLVSATVVLLAWALYAILSRVNRNLALLAVLWRVTEVAIMAVTTLTAFVTLRLLSDAPYLRAIDPAELQALARASLSVYGSGLRVAFVFLGLGSAVFGYLWFRSRYIPRALALFGIFSSLLLAVGSLVNLAFPGAAAVAGMGYMLPMGVFEVSLGLWLIFKGLGPTRIEEAA